MIRVALDVMGGDKAPEEIKAGALMFAEELKKAKKNIHLILIGTESALSDLRNHRLSDYFTLEIVRDYLPMDIKPTEALRRKESSMYIGAQLLKEHKVDAFVSAGNTGALLAYATLVVGRLSGIDRPALAVPIPSLNGFTVLIDGGANAEVRPDYLVQFAAMGVEYARTLGKSSPKVGLLNVGTEENKGTDMHKLAYQMLREKLGPAFHGNVEGNDINLGTVDVVVTDGFTGNVALKTMEGVAKLISHTIKSEAKKGIDGLIGALLFSRVLKKLKQKLDPRTYGGTFFLGVDGIVVKAHGNSDRVAIKNALKVAVQGVEKDLIKNLEAQLERWK
ncbi:phosphate:acyl-[acyl carrier protein] acyltransferase [Fervidobacterium changbaicum]|uniref:Phosphate acyltransferase n=2 Tax=Fervidobacterium TaxID=2422 RepID=A0AAI8CLG5_FERIS|nr:MULTISPECIES: phosphate acyltransferase PlsX [Fervidobacterium]AMW32748.1 phosphate acyltransferase PlsX [Fervidobacterium islandicum]QAV32784.1 phosphate acyltransferase PlsX [Fervidobacterium changbaicum]SDG95642.1 phosphate:acyl-[acyl carrier protein] acyltransferase [Fervidobacterium changbaicum]